MCRSSSIEDQADDAFGAHVDDCELHNSSVALGAMAVGVAVVHGSEPRCHVYELIPTPERIPTGVWT